MSEWEDCCRCCRKFIPVKGVMFCFDCELHRSWCIAQEPQMKGRWDPDLRRWVKKEHTDGAQAAHRRAATAR